MSQQQVISTVTAITRSKEQLRNLRQKMTENRSEGLRKYNPRAKVPILEDEILLDTYEDERELATKVLGTQEDYTHLPRVFAR